MQPDPTAPVAPQYSEIARRILAERGPMRLSELTSLSGSPSHLRTMRGVIFALHPGGERWATLENGQPFPFSATSPKSFPFRRDVPPTFVELLDGLECQLKRAAADLAAARQRVDVAERTHAALDQAARAMRTAPTGGCP